LRTNRHDTGSTTALSVDEVALIRDTISHYAPVLIAPLSKSVGPACREFFLHSRPWHANAKWSALNARGIRLAKAGTMAVVRSPDFLRALIRETALATLIHQRRLTPSCGGQAPTAERTVGPARMIAESLTPKPGIREQYLPRGDTCGAKSLAAYSITSSASATKFIGNSMPVAFAVLRLMTSL
jgi:hypothetical protein